MYWWAFGCFLVYFLQESLDYEEIARAVEGILMKSLDGFWHLRIADVKFRW